MNEHPSASFDPRQCLWVVGRLFPPNRFVDAITTTGIVDAPPNDVWLRVLFYEEVPRRPPFMLRALLPSPVRMHPQRRKLGAAVECAYTRGSIVRRITLLDKPWTVRFEVLDQRLGIERCVTAVEGVYEIRAAPRGAQVKLVTKYRGHLRPRWVWRPVERVLAHAFHRHILTGMGATRIEPESMALSPP